MSRKRTKRINGELYYRTLSGVMVNIDELVRIYNVVDAEVKPDMTDSDVDKLITATVKRMSPN